MLKAVRTIRPAHDTGKNLCTISPTTTAKICEESEMKHAPVRAKSSVSLSSSTRYFLDTKEAVLMIHTVVIKGMRKDSKTKYISVLLFKPFPYRIRYKSEKYMTNSNNIDAFRNV